MLSPAADPPILAPAFRGCSVGLRVNVLKRTGNLETELCIRRGERSRMGRMDALELRPQSGIPLEPVMIPPESLPYTPGMEVTV